MCHTVSLLFCLDFGPLCKLAFDVDRMAIKLLVTWHMPFVATGVAPHAANLTLAVHTHAKD